ncbi:MAG: hydrogenase [Ignavibacteriales bacterium]|nr:hydrogenase [Ignavibacteriales bacterium]
MGIIHLSTIGLLIDIFAAAILVTAVLIVSSRSLVFYIRLFALQSFFLGAVALLVVLGYGETHILIAAFLTIAVKAIALPMVLTRVIERIQVRKEIEFSINITASLLLCAGMVILSDSVAQSILSSQRGEAPAVSRVLSVSIAMMLIGLFIMMTRKKALTQIIGLLTMENGVFLSGLSITYGMPLIVEVGIFFDIMIAVLILGVFVFRINKTFETISIDSLRNLRH